MPVLALAASTPGARLPVLLLRLQVLERERRWQIAAQQREAQLATAAS